MIRSRRLQPVQRVIGDLERQRAGRLAASERTVAEAQARLDELTRYRDDYLRRFATLAAGGLGGMDLRDYQTFLARLGAAIRAQSEVLDGTRTQRDAELSAWQSAAARAKAVEKVVERWRTEERLAADRREQKEADERGLRQAQEPKETS
jgi:flagellar FliJ protein